jgi:hypothetical protein
MSGTGYDNQPVGQRLFGGLAQLFGGQPSGTAPSVAAMGELERIARATGRLPPIDPMMLAGLMPGAAGDRLAGLPPEWRAALSAPVQTPMPVQGNAVPPPQGASDPIIVPPTIPPELDQSNTPRTPPARPEVRTESVPQNPGELNWMALLESDPTPLSEAEYPTDRLLPGMQALRQRRLGRTAGQDNPGIAPDQPFVGRTDVSGPGGAEGDPLPTPPILPEAALPVGTDNAAVGAPTRTRYAPFAGQMPTGQAALDAWNAGRPQERQRNPEERMMRLIAAALAGGMRETGLGVGGGAAAGLGAGYGQESDRDEALWQRSETERQRFQQGLAGLLGQQEQQQFDNMMARQTFDRQSQALGDQDSRVREGLAIQRQAAGEQSLLRRMRMQRMLEQSGMEAQPAQVLTRGVEHVVRNPGTQLLVTDGEGRTRPLTFRVGDRELTLAQLQDRLLQQRGNPANARTNPLFATNPQLARDQTRADVADMLMQQILGLPEAQRRQVMQQMLPMIQSRARAGSQEISDE